MHRPPHIVDAVDVHVVVDDHRVFEPSVHAERRHTDSFGFADIALFDGNRIAEDGWEQANGAHASTSGLNG